MTTSVAIDLGVAALLSVTIGFCVVLERRLRQLRHAQSELAALIQSFNLAALRADSGIASLKALSDTARRELHGGLERATPLIDELRFLCERGDRLAERLAAPQPRAATGPHGVSDVETELAAAFRTGS
jgi:hypothetical protein